MLTPQEINFLYQLLDQISVRGEEQKALALSCMRKLRILSQPPPAAPPVEEEDETS